MLKPLVEKPSKNIYYLASSAAQKCIRRGHAIEATNFAKVMWQIEPYQTWRRMWIWLSEDCCRNVQALRLFYDWKTGSTDFMGMVPLIKSMANGPKDRSGANLSHLIRSDEVNPIRLWCILRGEKVHNRVLTLMKEWDARKYECYDAFDFKVVTTETGTDFSWIVTLAERGHAFDREGFICAIPYFFMRDTFEGPGIEETECGGCTWYDEWFPLEAVDGHTRPGGSAFAIYCKHRGHPELGITNSFALKPYVFFNEGWLSTWHRPYSVDFIRMWMNGVAKPTPTKNMTGYWTPEVRDFMTAKVIPELNNVRTWTLNKMFKAEMDEFKRLYHDNWVD